MSIIYCPHNRYYYEIHIQIKNPREVRNFLNTKEFLYDRAEILILGSLTSRVFSKPLNYVTFL